MKTVLLVTAKSVFKCLVVYSIFGSILTSSSAQVPRGTVFEWKHRLCLLTGVQIDQQSAGAASMLIFSSIEGEPNRYNSTNWDCWVVSGFGADPISTRLTLDSDSQKFSEYAASISTDGEGSWATVWTVKKIGPPYRETEKMAFAVSQDDGRTWHPPRLLFPDRADNLDDSRPTLRSYGKGRWAIIWTSNIFHDNKGSELQTILLTRSENNGTSWTTPKIITTASSRGAHTEKCNSAMAIDRNGNWLVAWPSRGDSEYDTETSDLDLYFSHSKDMGESWTAPARIAPIGPNENDCDIDPVLEKDENGNCILAWLRTKGTESPHIYSKLRIYSAASNDFGLTWKEPIRLDQRPPDEEFYVRNLTLASNGFGKWYCAWAMFDDIWTTSSSDDGGNWSKPLKAVSEYRTLRNDRNSYPFFLIDSKRAPYLCWIQEFEEWPTPDDHAARVQIKRLPKTTESHRK